MILAKPLQSHSPCWQSQPEIRPSKVLILNNLDTSTPITLEDNSDNINNNSIPDSNNNSNSNNSSNSDELIQSNSKTNLIPVVAPIKTNNQILIVYSSATSVDSSISMLTEIN